MEVDQPGRFDVIVLGAGPGASATAIRCHRAGLRVAMFAPPPPARRAVTPETLPPEAGRHWRELGFADTFAGLGFPRHRAMSSAWGSATLSTRYSICDVAGPGWYVDRARLDRALLELAAAQVTRYAAEATEVARRGVGWDVAAPVGRVTGDVVIDATGRRSWLGRRLGARRAADDRHVCFSMRAAGHAPDALVESGRDGWWFSAPVARGELGVTWFSRPGCFRADDLAPAALATRLAATMHTRARVAVLDPASLTAGTARTDWLEPCAGDGWFAVGDAAMACDPLSSMGVGAALDDAERVAALIAHVPTAATAAYRAAHAARLRQFLRERAGFYAIEQRWPSAPFWTTSKAGSRRED